MSYQPNRWTRRVIRPLLIATMVTSLVMSLVVLVNANSSSGRWLTLLPFIFGVALEATYTTQWLRHPDRLKVNQTAYRTAEVIMITFLTRIVSWLLFGNGVPQWADIQTYLSQPLTFFIESLFVPTLIFVLLVWRLAVSVSSLFSYITLSEYEIRFYNMPLAKRKERIADQPIQRSRRLAAAQFRQQWIWGGIFLTFITALGSFDLGELANRLDPFAITRLGIPPQMLIALLLYFGCGFWLLNQARLSVLNAYWLLNGIKKDENIERIWQYSSLILLLTVAFVAAFVPIGSTLPIGRLIGLLISGMVYIAQFLLFLLALLLTAVLSLFANRTSTDSANPTPPPLPTFTPPTTPPVESTGDSLLMQLLFSSAFWAIIIIVTVLAVLYFLRERGIRLTPENLHRYWHIFTAWVRQAWQSFWAGAEQLRTSLQAQFTSRPSAEQESEKSKRRWRFIHINALSPRDQIRYFYLSTVRRASRRGVQRQQSETPLEYVEDLKREWPAAKEDVEDLTSAFLKARYSPQPVEKEDVNPVKETWKQVKSELRRKFKQEKPSEGLEE